MQIYNASELATCQTFPKGNNYSAGKHADNCDIRTNCSVNIHNTMIYDLQDRAGADRTYDDNRIRLDATGKIVIPGFIDCHTHTVYGGSRAEEYEIKVQGASYADLHKKKGGIHLTVTQTREATEDELYDAAKKRLADMLEKGTTTVEIKSGYGLTWDDEMRMLLVIKALTASTPQDVYTTFLGAHTVPEEYTNERDEYVALVLKMLHEVKKDNRADAVDIFSDPLGFNVEETRKILTKAKELGFPLHVHAEQTAHMGGARLAAELGALNVSHCDFMQKSEMRLLAERERPIPAVLLPGVILHLMEWNKADYPKLAKNMQEVGVPITFATDYNPGSAPIRSMKQVMDLGLRFFKMSYGECLNAATINAAYALGLEKTHGSIEYGKHADLLVIDAPSVKDYLHQPGDWPIDYVIKKGRIVGGQLA